MDALAEKPEYSHAQQAPLCLLVYALAAVFLALGWFIQDAPPFPWLFPPIGLLMLVIAASFHHLTVEDQGDVLSVRFGPVPLFRKTVKYSDIVKVEVGRTLLLDEARRGTPSPQPIVTRNWDWKDTQPNETAVCADGWRASQQSPFRVCGG